MVTRAPRPCVTTGTRPRAVRPCHVTTMTVLLPSYWKKRASKIAQLGPSPHGDEDEEQRYRPIDRALLLRTLKLLAPYKRLYAVGVALGVGMTIAEMMSPKYTQWIINYGVGFASHSLSPMPATRAAAIGHIALLIGAW